MKNVVFLPSCPELRTDLFKLGLSLFVVKINSQSYYMVDTNQIKLAKELAIKHNVKTFFISDSRRQTFRLDLSGDDFSPTMLGTLQRSLSQDGSSLATGTSFFLSVTEDNKTQQYTCK